MMERSIGEGEEARNGVAVSDELSIQFVNTVAWRLRGRGEERLPSSEALLDWFRVVGVVTPSYSARLQAHWRKHPDEAERLYKEAIVLREAVYQLFRARLAAQRFFESHMKIRCARAPPGCALRRPEASWSGHLRFRTRLRPTC